MSCLCESSGLEAEGASRWRAYMWLRTRQAALGWRSHSKKGREPACCTVEFGALSFSGL